MVAHAQIVTNRQDFMARANSPRVAFRDPEAVADDETLEMTLKTLDFMGLTKGLDPAIVREAVKAQLSDRDLPTKLKAQKAAGSGAAPPPVPVSSPGKEAPTPRTNSALASRRSLRERQRSGITGASPMVMPPGGPPMVVPSPGMVPPGMVLMPSPGLRVPPLVPKLNFGMLGPNLGKAPLSDPRLDPAATLSPRLVTGHPAQYKSDVSQLERRQQFLSPQHQALLKSIAQTPEGSESEVEGSLMQEVTFSPIAGDLQQAQGAVFAKARNSRVSAPVPYKRPANDGSATSRF